MTSYLEHPGAKRLVNQLYQQALTLVDDDSKAHLKKYYHRVDSVREYLSVQRPGSVVT